MTVSQTRLDDFEACRPLLFAIAYRMLGSAMEAEDVVQDAYLRYHAAPDDARSPRAFLSTIATRLCLDRLKSARAQREHYIGPWLPEPILTAGDDHSWQTPEAVLDARESVSMAMLVLLESLSPVERAVFLLREVFDFGYDEIADMVGRREDACRQIFRRAKLHIAAREHRYESSPEEQQRLTSGFVQAATTGDFGGLTRLLAEDITFWSDGGGKVAAALRPIRGRDAVARFIMGIMRKVPSGITGVPAEINGSPGLIILLNGAPLSVLVFEMDGQQIREIRAVGNPDKLKHISSIYG